MSTYFAVEICHQLMIQSKLTNFPVPSHREL